LAADLIVQQPGFFHGPNAQILIEYPAAGIVLPDGQGSLPVGGVQPLHLAVNLFAQGIEAQNFLTAGQGSLVVFVVAVIFEQMGQAPQFQ
jgi:hypothetical protein